MIDRLRIAHVTATFPPYRGGTGNVCYHNARELARRGHDVHVFTATVDGAPQRETLDGIEIHRLRPLVRVGNAPVLPQLFTTLRGFDVIHLHYPFIFGAELVRLTSLFHRTPFVITLHNDLIGDGARAKLFAGYQQISAWMTVRHAKTICAVSMDHYNSSNLRASLNGRGPKAVEIPNGVDTAQFSPHGKTDVRQHYRIPEDSHLMLFVAALDRAHHFKGLERLLEALDALDDKMWLLVVGDGDLRAEYQQLARTLGIDQCTVFAGAIDHDQLPPFFRAADVTVLPSSAPESFGLVLIESMACGTPVVASDIPGVRTVVTAGVDGFLVQPENGEALRGRLQTILAMPATQRESMGQAGRRKVEERYAWEQIGARLETVYREVLHRSSSETKSVPVALVEPTGDSK